jgi:hypothetical protein
MTYDDWKATDPRDLEPEEREEEQEEPEEEPQGTDFSRESAHGRRTI